MGTARRARRLVTVIAGTAIFIATASFTIGRAQEAAGRQTAPPARGVLAEAPNFVGRTATLDTTGYSIGRRVFEAGGHNATFHMHSAGQLIFAESGHGRYQEQGKPIHELAPGESGYIPAGVMHWHGAVPNENFTMTFITMGASTTTQGALVTPEIYLGKK